MEVVKVGSADEGKSTLITCKVSAENAVKLIALFNSGKLAELGVTELQMHPEPDAQVANGKWATQSAKKQERSHTDRSGPT